MKNSKEMSANLSEEDREFYDKSYTSLGELSSLIEKMENNTPDKRTKKLFEEWRSKINYLIDNYNNRCGFKIYKKYA